MPAEVVLFDVNETLVDLAALDDPFEEAFGDAAARQDWFASLLHTALRLTATGTYAPLSGIGAAALDALAERRGCALSAPQREAILDGMNTLPAHPDAAPALERLGEAGFRLAALTNSPASSGREKLEAAGLARHFEAVFSASEVERFKPAPAPYRMAVRRLSVAPEAVFFVAAHDWDLAGARHVGCRTAFVARPGKRLGPLVEPPDVTGPDLEAVAEGITKAAGV